MRKGQAQRVVLLTCCCGSPMLRWRWWRSSGKKPRAHDSGGIRCQLRRLPPPLECLRYACARLRRNEYLTAAWVQRLPLRAPKSPLTPHVTALPEVSRSNAATLHTTTLAAAHWPYCVAGVAGVASMALQLNCRCRAGRQRSKSVALPQLHISRSNMPSVDGSEGAWILGE